MVGFIIFDSGHLTYPTDIPQLQAFFRTILIDFDVISETRLKTDAVLCTGRTTQTEGCPGLFPRPGVSTF